MKKDGFELIKMYLLVLLIALAGLCFNITADYNREASKIQSGTASNLPK